MSTAPPPLPEHSSAAPPPFGYVLPAKPAKPPKDPVKELASDIRTNILGGTLACACIALVIWCGRTAGRAEILDQAGSVLLMLTDLFFVVLITLEPILIRRRRIHPKPGTPMLPAPPGFDPNPPLLRGTTAFFGFSIAGVIVATWVIPRFFMLGSAIGWSIFILQFYRMLLLLLFIGGDAAWARMRKWRVKHWNHSEPLNDAG